MNGAPEGQVTGCQFYGHDMLVTVKAGTAAHTYTVQARLGGRPPLSTGSTVRVVINGPVKAWPLAG